ncbi:hypothetical protein CROQUDRAFT_104979 [Cronartium quercuum f. sp. fusiforme G11]|uniref:Uncharacterized protein n=1 Tax=Cronartium quercuum f. sp. fusiforme G11 TaxID=708437 RepID=A0A9P6NU92_9BASI|nr:hypothetical protein CROQUDRAFT_104979 [Cronartium quercuum f. sp. fusiforme G11]
MSPEELAMINFVLKIPLDTNPYLAIANYMEAIIKMPPLPAWFTITQRAAMLEIQSLQVINARIKVKAFKFLEFSSLGLLRVDIPSMTAVAYGIYVPLALINLILEETMQAGLRDYTGEILLFGFKYLVIINASWSMCLVLNEIDNNFLALIHQISLSIKKGFMWACACQCAALVYESPLGPQANLGKAMNPIVRRTMNSLFVICIIVPMIFVLYCYTTVEIAYDHVKSIILGIVEKLYAEAPVYDPQTYSRLAILNLLTPARATNGALPQIWHLSLPDNFIFLCDCNSLYARSVSQKELRLVGSMGGEAYEKLAKASRKLRQQRRRLVLHALAAFTTTFVHIPVIIAQLSFKGDKYMNDERWILLTRVGLALPFSILGNIIIGILNLHARQQVKEMQGKRVKETSNMFSSVSGNHSSGSQYDPKKIFSRTKEVEPTSYELEMKNYSQKPDQLERIIGKPRAHELCTLDVKLVDVDVNIRSEPGKFGIPRPQLNSLETKKVKRKSEVDSKASQPTQTYSVDDKSDSSRHSRDTCYTNVPVGV